MSNTDPAWMDSFEWLKAEGFLDDEQLREAVARMRPDLKRVEGLRERAKKKGLEGEDPITVDFFLEAMDSYTQFLVSHRYVIKSLLDKRLDSLERRQRMD